MLFGVRQFGLYILNNGDTFFLFVNIYFCIVIVNNVLLLVGHCVF